MSTQPFIYGRPVRPDDFVDREDDLRTIFNRLRNGESTAVVGAPHIGKSSLLLKIADKATQLTFLSRDAQRLTFSAIDLHPVDSDYSPAGFWHEALRPLVARPGDASIARRLDRAAETDYDRRSLIRLFEALAERERHLVLLLDEFERLLAHPGFSKPSFFALLRSLATHTGGLALVIASRLSVALMNERGRGLLQVGSPFFNYFIELRLHPFNEDAVDVLLARAGDALSTDDRRFTRHVAGRHPFLIQAMAAAMVETGPEDRRALAAQRFYSQVAFHFDDLWHALDDRARSTALMLSLIELGGRALGRRFDFGGIEKVEAFGPELEKLAEQGLAEQVGQGWSLDWQHLLLWRGERWAVGTQAFCWWVRDVVVAGVREVAGYEEWLTQKRYRYLLTQEEWGQLTRILRKAPDWAVKGVGGLARSLFEELVRKR